MVTRSPQPGERGSALLMALGMAGLLSVLAMVIAGASASGTGLIRNEQARIEARHVADGALQRMVLALLDREQRARLPMDGTLIESRFLDRPVQVAVEDEWGKFDINRAPLGLLRDAFAQSGLPPGDRSALNQSLTYARASAKPGAQSFITLEALRRDAGVSTAAFLNVSPYLTIWSKTGLVDPWAARAPVLAAATGAPFDEITAFVLARTQSDRPALPDNLPSKNLASSPSQLFTIYATVPLDNGGDLTRRMTIRLGRNPGDDYQILDYR